MNTVHIAASKSYPVHIGSGILSEIGNLTAQLGKIKKAAVISDSNVFPHFGQRVCENLKHSGIETIEFIFPAGENSKNAHVYLQLMNFLADNHMTRSDCLIALGGGVVGDMTGFAAATYLRGVRYIQIPTTLLAMVDSSVGGKTAIDLDAGKNLCGAFWQPSLVLCDTETLSTLPEDIFRDGCAEVVKYSILYDPDLFSTLERNGRSFDRIAVITRCIQLKRDVVAQDEFDTGARMKLNLGHTFGHGIETASNYAVSHGKAVAIGIAIAARASNCPDTKRIISCLEAFGLPTKTSIPSDILFQSALSDKKRSGDSVNLIVPLTIGNCIIVPTEVRHIQSFIEEGL